MKYPILRSHTELSLSEWLSVVEYYRTHTAKETAAAFGLEHKQALVSALAREVPKTSHGGARHGSGNLSEDNRKAKEIAEIIVKAQTASKLHSLDAGSVNAENYNEKRIQARNTINATIAALKALAALLGAIALLYIIL